MVTRFKKYHLAPSDKTNSVYQIQKIKLKLLITIVKLQKGI